MRQTLIKKWLLMLCVVILSACSPNSPQRSLEAVQVGDVTTSDLFAHVYQWDDNHFENIAVGLDGDAYRIQTDISSYVRGFYQATYQDVVLDVRAVQLTDQRHNAFGVVCRGSHDETSANGYYFLISGDGAYSIRRGRDGDLQALIAWEKHSAIRPLEVNQMRVICVQDYLALVVNGVLVGEVRDSALTQGRIGFTATTREGEFLDVLFSGLMLSEGSLSRQ